MSTMDLNSPQTIRVFIADDHRTMLWGLTRLIESAAPRMTLAGFANSAAELLEKIPAANPDVIVLDLDLGGTDGASLIPSISEKSTCKVLVLTGNRDPKAHEAAIVRGARGVVGKDEPAEVLLRAIGQVHDGEVWINRSMMARVLSTMAHAAADARNDPDKERIRSLTQRERQIVVAVLRHCGAKGAVIAGDLAISENTLRNHLSVIYEKLSVRNRMELFAYASRHGIGATA